MIEAENASFTYQSAPSPALQDVTLTVQPGECVVLCGRSGCGKTSFTHLLNGLSPEFYPGTLTGRCAAAGLAAGEAAIEAYVPQVGSVFQNPKTQYFNVDTTAELAFPCENAGMEPQAIRRRVDEVVEQFQLGPLMDRSVFKLSGGEKQRVAFAAACMLGPRLLVLDEPTNHMDMRSKDILKNAIMKYDGTVVVVSHDREFLDGMVEKVYEFRDGGVKEYLGGIYYFLEKRKLESLQEIERRDAPAKMPAKGDEPKPAVSGKLSYEQRKEQEKQLRKAKKVVETIEAELADIEKRIAEYDARFAAATEYNEADYKAYNELKTRYDHQMHEWEKASYELEIIENE